MRVGVLEQRSQPGRVLYRFTHAFFRQTSVRRDDRAAAAAAAPAGGARARGPVRRPPRRPRRELAEHYAPVDGPRRPRQGGGVRRAGGAASDAVYAYGEAASHLERSRRRSRRSSTRTTKRERCDLRIALAQALIPAGEPVRVLQQVAEQAFRAGSSTSRRCSRQASLRPRC